MEFAGKIALVTGGAQGIGLAVATMLASRGARVAVLDRQADRIATVAATLPGQGHLALAVDLSDAAAIDAAVAQTERELGEIDLLASVAGVLHLASTQGTTDAQWQQTFTVNTTAVFQLCRAVAGRMQARRRGAIVVVGSNAASTPRLNMAAYAASKAATAQLLRCLALELAPHGIRCNIVSPGSTETDMQRQLWTSPDSVQSIIAGSAEGYRLGIPLGRIAQPEDIAEAVCYLASDRARHITLHDLRVDGGATLDA